MKLVLGGVRTRNALGSRPKDCGFVLIGIIPFIAVFMILSALFAYALAQEARTLRTCRDFVLDHQTAIAKKLTALGRLNPTARKLTLLRTKTKAMLASALASGDPVVISAAKAKDLKVHTQQMFHRAKQESLKAQLHFTNLYVRMRIASIDNPGLKNRGLGSATYRVQKAPRLSLTAFPQQSLTPEWRIANDGIREQELIVKYQFQSPFRAETFDKLFRSVSGTCSASIVSSIQTTMHERKTEGPWHAKLTEDNLFSKSFGF